MKTLNPHAKNLLENFHHYIKTFGVGVNNILLVSTFVASAFCSNYSSAQNNEVPFTQEDRGRLIRVEVKIEALDKRIDDLKMSTQAQFNDLKSQIKDIKMDFNYHFDVLFTFMLWGFGILFGGMGFLIGFIMWDRRTTLAPVIKENQAMKRVFLKLAENNLDVKKALREEGIL